MGSRAARSRASNPLPFGHRERRYGIRRAKPPVWCIPVGGVIHSPVHDEDYNSTAVSFAASERRCQRDAEQSTHVLNAVSPGFTSSLPFGEHLASEILERYRYCQSYSRDSTVALSGAWSNRLTEQAIECSKIHDRQYDCSRTRKRSDGCRAILPNSRRSYNRVLTLPDRRTVRTRRDRSVATPARSQPPMARSSQRRR